ncbi:MAG: carboxypeptidase-like regulatory domain-containing protein [Acidobacteriia bacterium]|nr:carboxypeptidase-like regulatory domain-containing protein [Terriglobia bacterium]
MRRNWLVLALASAALHAAVIRGTVVENQTGKPLMRAAVTLTPIAGTAGAEQSVRTNRYGTFEFLSLAAGSYLLKTSRRGFLPAEYGQRQWNSAGLPVALEESASEFLTVRMRRYGAIAGTVRDENDVGRAEWPVRAYRNAQPPTEAASATADERGAYRIGGLEPGIYLVRTGPMQDEDVGFLATFGQETLEPSEARQVRVYPDEDSKNADVRPIPGKLFTVSGVATADPPCLPVKVTLAGDMGRQMREGLACGSGMSFEFRALPSGDYEVYAEGGDPSGSVPLRGFYTRFRVTEDLPNLSVALQPVRPTTFFVIPRQAPGASSLGVAARRKDLAGVGEPRQLKLSDNRTALAPGRWELLVKPPAGYYVSDFGGGPQSRDPVRPDGWNEKMVQSWGGGSFPIYLSDGPGGLHGVAKLAGEPAAGAPVYLEGYDPATRRRTLDLRTARTDLRGAYRFENVAPGTYRVLATFEYLMPDAEMMSYAGAREIRLEPRADLQMDLELYGVR